MLLPRINTNGINIQRSDAAVFIGNSTISRAFLCTVIKCTSREDSNDIECAFTTGLSSDKNASRLIYLSCRLQPPYLTAASLRSPVRRLYNFLLNHSDYVRVCACCSGFIFARAVLQVHGSRDLP